MSPHYHSTHSRPRGGLGALAAMSSTTTRPATFTAITRSDTLRVTSAPIGDRTAYEVTGYAAYIGGPVARRRRRTMRPGDPVVIRFSISPDTRPPSTVVDRVWSYTDDLPTILWAEAVAESVVEGNRSQACPPKTRQQLLDFLRSTPIRLRMMPWEGEDIVVGVVVTGDPAL